MKKKLMVIFLLVFLLTGCISRFAETGSSEPENISEESFASEIFGSDAQSRLWAEVERRHEISQTFLKRIDNTTPYKKLISTSVDMEVFLEKFLGEFGTYSPDLFIGDIDKDFKIECLRQNEAGYLYSVHKVKQGGLLYLFFFEPTANVLSLWNVFYVQKSLSKNDFQSIQKGSTIEDVEKIDPMTTLYKEHSLDYLKKNAPLKGGIYDQDYSTRHYLTDGSFEIFYVLKEERLVVIQVNYYPYNYSEIEYYSFETADWHILPQDFLKP